MTQLTSAQAGFIESILVLKPSVAAFDCDGTLWPGDAGEGFFRWEMEQGLVSEEIQRWARARYAEYQAGKVAEEVMCGEMVTMHRGLLESAVQQGTDSYVSQAIAPDIFPEMRELVLRLRSSGCDVWLVSSSSQWVIRSAAPYFDIPLDRILAAEAAIENGLIVDRILRMPSGPGKPEALRAVLPVAPDCAFGNSIWDREMLEMVQHPFAINARPNLREIAQQRGWRLYDPGANHRGPESKTI